MKTKVFINTRDKTVAIGKITLKLNERLSISNTKKHSEKITGELHESYSPFDGLLIEEGTEVCVGHQSIAFEISQVMNFYGVDFSHGLGLYREHNKFMSGTVYKKTSLNLKGMDKPISLIKGDQLFYSLNENIEMIRKNAYFKDGDNVDVHSTLYKINDDEKIISSEVVHDKFPYKYIERHNFPLQ